MKLILRRVSIMALFVAAVGCSSPSQDVNLPRGIFAQQDAAREAFQYREQARYYSYLAQKLEDEARSLSAESASSDKRVQAKLALAQEYQRSAMEAAGRASETQSHVPHGMMQ